MKQITTIGLDLAKQVFQVHAASADGSPIFNRKLRRAEVLRFFERTPACLVGMEACGSAHYWAREIRALGHDVRLIPPVYVKPFVKRGKTDAADAEAISEAVTRKTMRFVPVKSADQQAAAVVLKTRAFLVNQRTQAINALRGHLSEFGIIAAAGTVRIAGLISIVRDKTDERLPKAARLALMEVASQIDALKVQIEKLEQAIVATVRRDDDARRLVTIPGVGAIIAASVRALVPDPGGFKSGRHFAAWLGNPVLRSLLVVGATAVLRHARGNPNASRWIAALLARRPYKVVAVALANKMARIIWALLVKGGRYQENGARNQMAAA
jgi:transposase